MISHGLIIAVFKSSVNAKSPTKICISSHSPADAYVIITAMGIIIAVDIGGKQIRCAAFPRERHRPKDVDRGITTHSQQGKPILRPFTQLQTHSPKKLKWGSNSLPSPVAPGT